ncbi:MAG: hypothetical protein FGM39_02600 [Phycisphaerales bacterium]|nr:hypothetical protein [Phycisphaerales bacterium]
MTKVALVVVYNHRFDRNIGTVERIYRGRFSHVFHLMPFYDGDRANVIPVYESSHYFQGYVAQAFPHLRGGGFTHYFVVADDLVLNPAIDERNFLEVMGLPDGHDYLPQVHAGGRNQHFWMHSLNACRWDVRVPGVEAAAELPPRAEALERLARHGIVPRPYDFERLWRTPTSWLDWARRAGRDPAFCVRYAMARLRSRKFESNYPVISGYSDVFVVTARSMPAFCRYCGVFAATRLFVENAIPTALALASEALRYENAIKLRGKALWTANDMRELDVHGRSLSALMAGFPPDRLFIHPVKLSGWLMDLEPGSMLTLDGPRMLRHRGIRHDVSDMRCEDGALRLRATSADPYFSLPWVPLEPCRDAWVRIDITVPEPTRVQLFWQAAGDEQFREERSASWQASAGRQTLARNLGLVTSGHLRVDPGTTPGDYVIHGIEFHQ